MNVLEIGVSMLHRLSEPFGKMVKKLAETTVNHVEVVDDGLHALDKRRVLKLREIGKTFGLRFSVHAPFADINIASPSKCVLKAMIKRLENSIKLSALLEATVWVFHPGVKTGISMFYPEADWTRNRETAKLLCKIAQKHSVEIAIENVPEPYPFLMKRVEHFKMFYEEIDENIGLALDVGHANLNGQIELFLKTFPDKIVHIHAHDNGGKEDEHLGIGRGTVDWKRFSGLLRQIAYNKAVVVESVEHVQESVERLKALLF
ncbi:MAG: sugar phosphate isomerase/epimerase [Candidatus Bathyarchaeota archaeon]|nr:sugar phosphate isomerase/epimerase [Candidatus Bathyarchaeota archaeon]